MSQETETIVYSPDASQSLFTLLLGTFRGFKEGHDLGKRLFIRDTLAQYRQSILGLLWVLIMPIAQTLVWVFLSKGGILNVGDSGVPYPVFVLSGVMFWRSFVDSVNTPLAMFNSSKAILKKINFPKEALLITAFYKVIFNLGINLIILIPLYFFYGIPMGWHSLLGLLALIPVLLLGMTIGILIIPFGALFNDVSKLIQSGMQLFFFLTPIIYPMPSEGMIATISKFNPAAISIVTARDLFFNQSGFIGPSYWTFLAITLVLLGLGMVIYKISLPIIIERSGS